MRELDELVTESRDLHSHALCETDGALEELCQTAFERRGDPVDDHQIRRYNESRRRFLASGLAAGLFAGSAGGALATMLARPAAADTPLDIQILQTAASLEAVAVSTYQAALGLNFIKSSAPSLLLFLQTTSNQHGEHGMAFRAQTAALGAPEQTAPHPGVQQIVTAALPDLTDELKVVQLAEQIETIATHTFLDGIAQLDDTVSRQLMATIMGVESQHAGMLRALAALLAADSPELIAIPVNPAALPSAMGSVATPDAVEPTASAVKPDSGAVVPPPPAEAPSP